VQSGERHDDRAMSRSHDIIELDIRTTDGIDVRLLWDKSENRLSVTASDVRSGETVEVEVRDHERALDVFHHPYAYAAFHGVEPLEARLLSPTAG
jgi:YD repeat-containing protein